MWKDTEREEMPYGKSTGQAYFNARYYRNVQSVATIKPSSAMKASTEYVYQYR